MNPRSRIGIVVQRYGEEVNGGAEALARWLAERLARTADVQVFTTCAVDFTTWADHYPPGDVEINGVQVHRFRVDAPRDWKRHQRRTAALFNRPRTVAQEIAWVHEQGPYSQALLEAISDRYESVDAFVFFTFHYATTHFGLPLVSDKAILVPTAHDDPFLHLGAFRPTFHLPFGIVYLTEPERDLVQRVTRNDRVRSTVAGISVEAPADLSGQRFRDKYGIEDEFLLYAGRIDPSKNVPELLDFFERFQADTAAGAPPLKLVLIGKTQMPLPERPDILYLGFVPEADKFDALRAATVVMMPSLYESLSIITLEAWAAGTPVLANGRCEVVKHLCKQSNGGLYYHNYEEFLTALRFLLAAPALRTTLGAQGRRYVARDYRDEVVLRRYTMLLEELEETRAAASPGQSRKPASKSDPRESLKR
jgi:glycosyltransferase involved in cell wall biosynthesis